MTKKNPHKMLWFKTYFKHSIKLKFHFLFYCIAQQYIRISVLQTQGQLKSHLYLFGKEKRVYIQNINGFVLP